MDGRSFDLSVAFGRRDGLVGGLGRFVAGFCAFAFGGCALCFLGSDRLKALSLSVLRVISGLGVGIGTGDSLLLWRSTLLGRRSDRFSGVSVGVGLDVGSSGSFLGGGTLLGWLGRFIVGGSGGTALLGCLGGGLGSIHLGALVDLGLISQRTLGVKKRWWRKQGCKA